MPDKQGKKREPLQPRQGPYQKVNSWTRPFCKEQIITFLLMITVIVLHSVFVIRPIFYINSALLYILLGLNYALLLVIIISYIQITTFDPVDTYIVNPQQWKQNKKHSLSNSRFCHICRSIVHKKSYHCKRCNRCTQDFDHHCLYLNNCIGARNYQVFMRLLLSFLFFQINVIGQCIWVFVLSFHQEKINQLAFNKWVLIGITGLCFLQVLASIVLLFFHLYISCCLDVTTLMFIESTQDKSSQRQGNGNQSPHFINPETPINLLKNSESLDKLGNRTLV